MAATPMLVQVLGAVVGLSCLAAAGWSLGGLWWGAAALGALGIASGRLGAVAHAVATVVLAGGAVSAEQRWLVPLLVVGVVSTVEAAAARERYTVVRTGVDGGRVVAAAAAAGGLSAVLVVLATWDIGPSVPAMLLAAGATVALLASLRS